MAETLKEELARLERQREEATDSHVRAVINNRIAELKRQLEKVRKT
jgi:hypothetical protein